MAQEAYCMTCKKKQPMKSPAAKTTKNGRKMLQCPCPKCGTKMSVFVKKGQ